MDSIDTWIDGIMAQKVQLLAQRIKARASNYPACNARHSAVVTPRSSLTREITVVLSTSMR